MEPNAQLALFLLVKGLCIAAIAWSLGKMSVRIWPPQR